MLLSCYGWYVDKENVQWCRKTGKFVGYVDLGADDCSSEKATEAFVFMAVGLRGHWRIPLGYFLINGISACTLINLLKEAIIRLYSCGVIVQSVTSDAAQFQISAIELLGANFNHFSPKPWFPHPCDPTLEIVFIHDVCHMIKLIRKALEFYGFFKWKNGSVSWKYYKLLEDLQSKHHLRGGNRLTKQHIEFENKKMKVSLATQLFSKSVADTLRYCYFHQIEGFQHPDVLLTAEFTELMNDLFDVFNSSSLYGKFTHSPITTSNIDEKKQFLKSACDSLKNIYVKDKSEVKAVFSRRKAAFKGFISNSAALVKLYEVLLTPNNSSFKAILTYKLSQDFLESFFGSIRARNGLSSNPTAIQFMSAFKYLLFLDQKTFIQA